MYYYQDKFTRHRKRLKTKFEEIQQASEPDTAGMLKTADLEFITTMTNMLVL